VQQHSDHTKHARDLIDRTCRISGAQKKKDENGYLEVDAFAFTLYNVVFPKLL
jgi:hypothetical protein